MACWSHYSSIHANVVTGPSGANAPINGVFEPAVPFSWRVCGQAVEHLHRQGACPAASVYMDMAVFAAREPALGLWHSMCKPGPEVATHGAVFNRRRSEMNLLSDALRAKSRRNIGESLPCEDRELSELIRKAYENPPRPAAGRTRQARRR
jgi:hypothetical protein